jgi:YqaJ-like viral recombinase domain
MFLPNPNLNPEQQQAIFCNLQTQTEADKALELWMESRRGKITASSAWKLITSTYKPANNDTRETYILEKVAEILGATTEEWDTASTIWGKENEAIQTYENKTKSRVSNPDKGISFILYDNIAGATPDGYVKMWGLIEVKCPYNPAEHVKHLLIKDQDDLKRNYYKYYTQVQFQMLVTGKRWADFVSYDKRMKEEKHQLKRVRIKRDLKVIELLKQEIAKAKTEIDQFLKAITQ